MAETTSAYARRMEWFHQARFGMFIHWGLYSLLGRGTWVMHHDQLPVAEMERLAGMFTARKFDANAWAELANSAGMKYAILTTRHHDGFCLFDSQVSDFTSVRTAARRDLVAEYVTAFRNAGLKVGFYYSLLDWRFPGYFEPEKYPDSAAALVEQAHAQVRELLRNYGKIDVIWFDGHWFQNVFESMRKTPDALARFWRSEQLEALIRDLQPHIIINDRCGISGDYSTPEQRLPGRAQAQSRPWELCETIGDYDQSWCHQRYTPMPIRKTVGKLLLELVTTAGGCGNMLLNVGPKYDGSIPAQDAKRLRAMGEWLKVNGEAVYGSEPSPINGTSVGEWTFKRNVGYLHMPCWPGKEVIICRVDGKVQSASLLGSQVRLAVDQDHATGRITIQGLPTRPPYPDVNILRVTFDRKPARKEAEDTAAWLQG